MRRRPIIVALFVLMALLLAACGGGETPQQSPEEPLDASSGDVARGEDVYRNTCIPCHGEGAQGVQGLGKNWQTSTFIAESSDQELLEFIKVGRDPSDEMNTTGVAMPAKGGKASLTDQQIIDVIAYMRSLQ